MVTAGHCASIDREKNSKSFLVLKMFEWDEDEEVRDTIWGVQGETENNIAPYPKGNEDDLSCSLSGFPKRQRHEENIKLSITDQRKSEATYDSLGTSLVCNDSFNRNGQLSASQFGLGEWPDLPSFNCAFSSGGNHLNSMSSKSANDCHKSLDVETVAENMVAELYDADAIIQGGDPSLIHSCSVSSPDITKLHSGHDIFLDEHEEKERDNYLNCDWDSIADFDDFDRIFRSDVSIFGHETSSNSCQILQPSMDADVAVVPSFAMPVDKQPGTGKKTLEKDKEPYQPQLSIGTFERDSHLSIKKKISKSQRKMAEKSRTRTHQCLISSSPSSMSGIHPLENIEVQASQESPPQFHSAALSQARERERQGYTRFLPGISQHVIPGCDFPMHALSMMPTPAQHEIKQKQSTTVSFPSKPTSDFHSKPLSMSPQEKIEKLRRRQQMQAMLAIQQQHQQLGHQSSSAEMYVSQTSRQMNQNYGAAACTEIDNGATKWLSSSEWNVTLEANVSQTIISELQDAIGKLDISLRLCICDSLFRLARSAMERQNAGDGNSTNINGQEEDEISISEETSSRMRSMKLSTETGTNPMDRIVAHLLFHWPSGPGSRPVKDEMLPSPISSNPALKLPRSCGDMPEDEADEFGTLSSM